MTPGSTTVLTASMNFSAFDQLEAFDHMQSSRMRRAVIIDEALIVHPDRIDDKVVAFVMAN